MIRAILLVIGACALIRGVQAQCEPHWLGAPAIRTGVGASTIWDSDGPGPLPPRFVLNVGTAINTLGLWDGLSLVNVPGPDGVLALTTLNDDVIAGGSFSNVAGIQARNIAALVGSSWHNLGAGVNGPVNALVVYHGDLIAGGIFSTADGATVSNIARWDGVSWHPLAAGVNSWVYSLLVFNDELVAGGQFTTAGEVPANYVARWNGSSWSSMGTDMPFFPMNMTVHNGTAVAGTRYSGVVQWTGSSWQSIAGGPIDDIEAVFSFHGDLVCTGYFHNVGSLLVNGVARWTGTSWEGLSSGLSAASGFASGYSMGEYAGELIIAGNIDGAGGVQCHNWARWTDTGVPEFARQPSNPSPLCQRGDVNFSAAATIGYTNTSYRWRRNGVSLSDGPTGTGSTLAGTTTTALTVAAAFSADAGRYDCVISNTCGESVSASARLVVNTADFNNDGSPGTDQDIEAFFACLAGNCCSTCSSTDFNGDGDVGTDQDIEAFFRVLAGGAC